MRKAGEKDRELDRRPKINCQYKTECENVTVSEYLSHLESFSHVK